MDEVVRSEFPGTVYRSPGPDAPPFVTEGDEVEAGDVIAVIEIMKQFFDIIAQCSGVVERFLVENEKLVEAGQPIAVIRR